MDKYLLKLEFRKGTIDSNLYFKIDHDNILIVEFFVDDNIFGRNDSLCKKFSNEMENEFDISISGEMKFLLGFQIN